MRAALVAALVLWWAAAAGSAAARADGELAVQLTSIRDEGGRVTAVFTVLDAAGRPVPRLDARQVQARVDGVDVRVGSLSAAVSEQLGVAVVLTVDTSGSMAGAPIASARDAAARFIDGLAPQDAAALVAFADGVAVEQPLTSDRVALRASVDRLRALGETALYDAVATSIAVASAAPQSRKAVVLLSDGAQSGSSQTAREAALQRAGAGGVVIYVIAYGSGIDQAFLGELAARSGGRLLVAPTTADLGVAYAELSELLRSQHVLVVEAPPSAAATRSLELTVTAPAGSGHARAPFSNSSPLGAMADAAATPASELAAPAPANRGGFGRVLVLALLVVAVLAVAGGGWLVQRRRRAGVVDGGGEVAMIAAPPRRPPAAFPAHLPRVAVLTVIAGPEQGRSVQVREGIVTVGSSPVCTLRLLGAPGDGAAEQLRLWWRDEQLMLHALDGHAYGATRPAWSSLRSGDVLELGAHRIEVHIAGAAPAAVAALGADGRAPARTRE